MLGQRCSYIPLSFCLITNEAEPPILFLFFPPS